MASEHKLSFRHWFSIFFFFRFLEGWVYRFASVFPISDFVFLSIWLNFCRGSPTFSWLWCSWNRSELRSYFVSCFLLISLRFESLLLQIVGSWFSISTPWSNELHESATASTWSYSLINRSVWESLLSSCVWSCWIDSYYRSLIFWIGISFMALFGVDGIECSQ